MIERLAWIACTVWVAVLFWLALQPIVDPDSVVAMLLHLSAMIVGGVLSVLLFAAWARWKHGSWEW